MTERCGYQHCGHAPHRGQCPATWCRCPKRVCTCGAPIAVATTVPGGKTMPLNAGATRDPAANVAVWDQPDGSLRCRVLAKGELGTYTGWRAVPHWASCPDAARHRSRKAAAR